MISLGFQVQEWNNYVALFTKIGNQTFRLRVFTRPNCNGMYRLKLCLDLPLRWNAFGARWSQVMRLAEAA